jgi:hypothetical protein
MDLVEVGWGDVDWIGLAQDRDKFEFGIEHLGTQFHPSAPLVQEKSSQEIEKVWKLWRRNIAPVRNRTPTISMAIHYQDHCAVINHTEFPQ